MKKIFATFGFHTLATIKNHLLFRINYFLRFREYEYVYHLLIEELKSDPRHLQPEYQQLQRIIGTGGTELFGCRGISDPEAAQKYEKIFKKYGIVCSYDADIAQIYQHFKEEYVQ